MSTPAVLAFRGTRRARIRASFDVRNRRQRGRLIANAIGFVVLVVMVFPVYWMVATAFKPGRDILSLEPKWFPSPATIDNFSNAIDRPYFWDNVKNSVIIVTVVVVLALAIGFLAALAIARFRFYGRRAFIVVIIGVQMIPVTALIIPLYVLLARANMVDRLSGVIITYLTFVLPFTVWTLRGFVMGIPRELEEAAMVDGCTRFGAFMRILVPLIAPGLVATAIFAFVQAWNEFILAYVLLSSQENQTLQVWLATFTTRRGTDWGPLMAAATLTSLPVVIFFAIVQRRVAFGLTAGAVRG
jgi:N,N'-diacetylchitobiose transport system permease protein